MALVKEIFSFTPLPNHTPILYSPPPGVFFCSPLPWKNFFAPPHPPPPAPTPAEISAAPMCDCENRGQTVAPLIAIELVETSTQ